MFILNGCTDLTQNENYIKYTVYLSHIYSVIHTYFLSWRISKWADLPTIVNMNSIYQGTTLSNNWWARFDGVARIVADVGCGAAFIDIWGWWGQSTMHSHLLLIAQIISHEIDITWTVHSFLVWADLPYQFGW
jgi:hypothetical protein